MYFCISTGELRWACSSSMGETTGDGNCSADADGGEGGRLKVSATTLAAPATCRMSVTNSEMYDRWRVCRGDFSAEEDRAPQRGL